MVVQQPHEGLLHVLENTVAANRARRMFDDRDAVWLFGYGSLIFKADFPYLDRRPASIEHWVRRFWQGSHDHRGTPSAPGRVVTLVPERRAVCEGVAYLVDHEVFDHLDFREKNGYLRFVTDVKFRDGSVAPGAVYIATSENRAFLGGAPESEIARHIHASAGPSGPNSEYLLGLARALRGLSVHDPHVFAVESHLLALMPAGTPDDP
jgi:cation transport regulator ChaC